MTRNNLMGVMVLITLVSAANSASAYVVPADALLERTTKSRARLRLEGLVLQGTHEKDGVRSQVWEVIRAGGRRRELRRGDEMTVTLDLDRTRYEYTPGTGGVRPKRGPVNLLATLGFPTDPEQQAVSALEILKSLGVNTSVVSIGRQGRRLVFIIGAKSNDLNRPQLWLDKELMVPVRLIGFDRNRTRIETRWLGFASPLTRPYFPRRIETWVNGELTESLTYGSIEINPKLNDAWFSPPN
ncbi:MAG: hypothetical protein AAFV29_07685 [Myxococcota bacterium]